MDFEGNSSSVFRAMPRKRGGKGDSGEGGSGAQKRGPGPSPPDAVSAQQEDLHTQLGVEVFLLSTSDRSSKTKTTNLNLDQVTKVDHRGENGISRQGGERYFSAWNHRLCHHRSRREIRHG